MSVLWERIEEAAVAADEVHGRGMSESDVEALDHILRLDNLFAPLQPGSKKLDHRVGGHCRDH